MAAYLFSQSIHIAAQLLYYLITYWHIFACHHRITEASNGTARVRCLLTFDEPLNGCFVVYFRGWKQHSSSYFINNHCMYLYYKLEHIAIQWTLANWSEKVVIPCSCEVSDIPILLLCVCLYSFCISLFFFLFCVCVFKLYLLAKHVPHFRADKQLDITIFAFHIRFCMRILQAFFLWLGHNYVCFAWCVLLTKCIYLNVSHNNKEYQYKFR